jgi:hypothetical protein
MSLANRSQRIVGKRNHHKMPLYEISQFQNQVAQMSHMELHDHANLVVERRSELTKKQREFIIMVADDLVRTGQFVKDERGVYSFNEKYIYPSQNFPGEEPAVAPAPQSE